MAEKEAEKIHRQGLALILARGGSKGIPRKNIYPLAEKPLIAYTIEAAMKSKYIRDVYVSTDDDEISSVSHSYGARVIQRPSQLAQDDSTSVEGLIHLLNEINLEVELQRDDWFVHLQPTSPLRCAKNVDEAVELYFNNLSNVVSVCECEHHPYKTFIGDNGKVEPIISFEAFESPRQMLPKAYRTNGAIYIANIRSFLHQKKLVIPDFIPYIMSNEESVDIDNMLDIRLAEVLLKDRRR